MEIFTNIGLTVSGFVFLLFTTIGYINSKKVKTYESIFFKLMLISIILASLSDIAYGLFSNATILTILKNVYIITSIIWVASLTVYLISTANKKFFEEKKNVKLIGLITLGILIGLGIILKSVFKLIPGINDAKNILEIVGGLKLYYILPMLTTIISFIAIIIKKKDNAYKITYLIVAITLMVETLLTLFIKQNLYELTFICEIITIVISMTCESSNIKMVEEDDDDERGESEVSIGGQNEFISSMSHDIRTPLGAITGYTDILLNESGLTLEKAKDALSNIGDASEKLKDLMNNLVDISILNEGKETIFKEPFNVKKIAAGVEEQLSTKIERKGNTYSYLISERLPIDLDGDGEKLSRIFELLLNIINSHTSEGSITVNYSGEIYGEKYVIKGSIEAYNNSLTKEAFDLSLEKYMEMYADEINTIDSENLGLIIAKNYIELLDGTYEYIVDDNGKTICNVSIPVEFSRGEQV